MRILSNAERTKIMNMLAPPLGKRPNSMLKNWLVIKK
jgi:hypothetical protein